MKIIIPLIQIFISLVLIVLILLQQSTDTDSSSRLLSPTAPSRRGLEKLTFQATIIFIVIFIAGSLAQILL